jgi:glycosyltransferase involved in cell wall biosynthesis
MSEAAVPSLTVVIPVYNEASQIAATLRAAADAVEGSGFDGRFVVVDDGSSDGTAEAAKSELPVSRVTVLSQPNRGRLAARRAGLDAVEDEYVLFLDSRVRLAPDSLRFVRSQLDAGKRVWNAHVIIDVQSNPYGQFWDVLTSLVFSRYFSNPRETSYGAADFDAFPKGTTAFLAPTALMKDAFRQYKTKYRDERHANDDTPILRWIASQRPIQISPQFQCTYAPRNNFKGFARHAFHRGVVFVDGHGRRGSGLFPAVVTFYPLSLIGLVFTLKRPRAALVLAVGMAAAGGAMALRRGHRPAAAASFAALAPVYAVAHGAGMWRGLQLLLENRVRPTPK